MTTQVFSVCLAQYFANGAALTGVAPNGVDSSETHLRGNYRIWTACTDGGLFKQPSEATIHQSISSRVRNVAWNLPGVTDIVFSWVDMLGNEVPMYPPVGTASVTRNFWDPQQTVLILPQGGFKIAGTGPLSAAGGIVITWELGLEKNIFNDIGSLGKSNMPSLLG